ncbi:MAG: response regulator [Gemmatimonadota bacterium]
MQNEHIRVLLVDDDQGDFEMIRAMLAKAEHQSFKLDWVSTFEEALDAFEADDHDVYFLDYFLEDRTGLDLLKEAKARGITAPFIMLTGRGSRTVDMEAMDLGAADYLVKGLIDPDALERAIRHAIERAEGAQAIQERDERNLGMLDHLSEPRVPEDPQVSAARFRAVFESTRSGIALVELYGDLREVNSAFAHFFSPTPRWTENLSYLDLLDETDREAVSKELEALAKGERARFESARRFLVREDQVVWAHTTMVLIRDADGAPDHLVVLLEGVGEGG